MSPLAPPPQKRKEAIVLFCLIVLGFRINEWFLRACLWGCVVVSSKDRTEMKNRVGSGDREMYQMKDLNGNRYGLKGCCRVERKINEPKCKDKVREKWGQHIIKQKESFLGTVNRSNIHWLIVSLCHTELIPGDLVCVCGWGLRASAVVRTGGHAPLWTHSSNPIWSHSYHKGTPPFWVNVFCCSTLFSIYDRICLGTQESEAMTF